MKNQGLTCKQVDQLRSIAEDVQSTIGITQTSEDIAFIKLMRICRDYCKPIFHNVETEESRRKTLMDRLDRFRIKYYEDI